MRSGVSLLLATRPRALSSLVRTAQRTAATVNYDYKQVSCGRRERKTKEGEREGRKRNHCRT